MERSVSKEEMDYAFSLFPPNKYVAFMYAHFSKGSEKKGFMLGKLMTVMLIGAFAVGFIITVLDVAPIVIAIATYTYTGILALIVPAIFVAFIMNRNRIKKVVKYLGISDSYYNYLVELYY